MLDLFTIFSKGGIVLWCFQGTDQALTSSVNALIKSVILQVSYAVFLLPFLYYRSTRIKQGPLLIMVCLTGEGRV